VWHGIGQQQSALKGAMRAEAADPTETLLYSSDNHANVGKSWSPIYQSWSPIYQCSRDRLNHSKLTADSDEWNKLFCAAIMD